MGRGCEGARSAKGAEVVGEVGGGFEESVPS